MVLRSPAIPKWWLQDPKPVGIMAEISLGEGRVCLRISLVLRPCLNRRRIEEAMSGHPAWEGFRIWQQRLPPSPCSFQSWFSPSPTQFHPLHTTSCPKRLTTHWLALLEKWSAFLFALRLSADAPSCSSVTNMLYDVKFVALLAGGMRVPLALEPSIR